MNLLIERDDYQWDHTKVITKMFKLLLELFPNEHMVHGAIQACFDTTLTPKNLRKVLGSKVE